MNGVAIRAKLQETFADKPHHLEELYIDMDDQIRDRHIEHMFGDCYYGRDLDDIFIHNFRMYFSQIAERFLPRSMYPHDVIFTDADLARAWVTHNFGLIYVGSVKPADEARADEDLDHCLWEAKLRSRVADNINESCYAPTALHAILLTVVNVMRHLVHNYHQELIQ